MDGKGRWMENVFIERLWMSVKYERIHLFEYTSLPALHGRLGKWFERYDHWCPHEKLGNLIPADVYQATRQGFILGSSWRPL